MAQSQKKNNKDVCKWFLNNRCTRGNNCRFSHSIEHLEEAKEKKVGTGKRLGKWKRDGLQSRSRKRDWELYNQGIKPSYDLGDPKIAPKCKCDLVCIKRKVGKKKARNYGKIYYNCPNWQDKKRNCAFFKWYENHDDMKESKLNDSNKTTSKSENYTNVKKKLKTNDNSNNASNNSELQVVDDSSSSSSSSSSDSSDYD